MIQGEIKVGDKFQEGPAPYARRLEVLKIEQRPGGRSILHIGVDGKSEVFTLRRESIFRTSFDRAPVNRASS